MPEAGTARPRERYRAQMKDEIKGYAWRQIATAGASALSLNAIAKQMGMSGPSLYRYFANRDALITELITDAYQSLADALHATAESGGDLSALARALRRWAHDDPQRYHLIYGTPVPGYHAPDDVNAVASEIKTTLLDACATLPSDHPRTPFESHLEGHRQWAGTHPASPSALQRGLLFWTRLHGVLSLELAGHFTVMGFDPAELFDAELTSLSTP
jgi:AcrR family transcriptional regulator